MDNQTIQGKITKAFSKPTKTGKTLFFYEIGGKTFSGFKDLEFKQGDEVNLAYETNGAFNNYQSGVMVKEYKKPEVEPVQKFPVEEVKDTPFTPAAKVSNSGSLKVKLIVSDDGLKFQDLVNQFNSEFNVKFSQYQFAVISDSVQYHTYYSMAIWYE